MSEPPVEQQEHHIQEELSPEELQALQARRREFWKNVFTWGALFFFALGYALLTASQISDAYVDFGDGNYLYISSRIADGLIPYEGIMAPQPPLHLLFGALVLSIGGKIGAELHMIRWFSIFLHIGVALTVASIARTAARSIWPALAAGAIYLFLPVGFVWSLGYQSEPLEILFLALMVRMILKQKWKSFATAAVFATLACFTNMTALPYFFIAVAWLIWRQKWRSLAFIIPFILLTVAGILVMEQWTNGHYLENVFFNQVGTFPPLKQLPAYVARKIFSEGTDVIASEGFLLALALLGGGFIMLREQKNHLEFLALFGLSSLASIVFVSKGGTADYIFTIGEPYVAVLSACLLAWIYREHEPAPRMPLFHQIIGGMALVSSALLIIWRVCVIYMNLANDEQHLLLAQFILEPLVYLVVLYLVLLRTIAPHWKHLRLATTAGISTALALGVFAWHSGLVLDAEVFDHSSPLMAWQLPPERTRQLDLLIEKKSQPLQPIISPPWFAYKSGRRLAQEYSETFIWTVGYFNEQSDRLPGQSAFMFLGPFTQKALDVANDLQQQKIPIVLLDNEQTGRIPEIKQALYGSASFPFWGRDDVLDADGLIKAINDAQNPISAHLRRLFLKDAEMGVLDQINRIMDQPLYDPVAFSNARLSTRTQQMLRRKIRRDDIPYFNRRLLAEAYPGLLALRPEGAKYQELTELTYFTRDTPLRFFIPSAHPTEPQAIELDDLIPVPRSTSAARMAWQ